jgi:hypothetical protein
VPESTGFGEATLNRNWWNRGHVGIALAVLAAAGSADARPGLVLADAAGVAPMSGQDELEQSQLIIARIDQASGTARRQLDTARQDHDVVKSLCLNDKLSQVDVAGRSAKDRQAALQSAIKRGDTELSNHEFTILTVLKQRVEQLSAEANQCVGEEIAFVGETQVTAQVDVDLPGTGDENTESPTGNQSASVGGTLPPPVVSVPSCVSCFQ